MSDTVYIQFTGVMTNGHAGNISVYGYVESYGRHCEADFVRRSGCTYLLNTCS